MNDRPQGLMSPLTAPAGGNTQLPLCLCRWSGPFRVALPIAAGDGVRSLGGSRRVSSVLP